MNKAYSCTFKTPQGEHNIEADNCISFLTSIMTEATRLIASCGSLEPQNDLDSMANKALIEYEEKFNRKSNRRYSPIKDKGFELDIMKCYLQNMTAEETVEWLKKNKNFITSKSSIGRYWRKFLTLDITPGKF